MMAIAIAFIAGWLLLRWLGHHVRAFWLRIEQGLVILRQPRRYFRTVVLYQALGWCCRLGTAYFLLEAFGVHATITNALLVLVVGSISTLLPITPGGAGAQQALLVIVLAGQASSSSLLAYSVGAQVAATALQRGARRSRAVPAVRQRALPPHPGGARLRLSPAGGCSPGWSSAGVSAAASGGSLGRPSTA